MKFTQEEIDKADNYINGLGRNDLFPIRPAIGEDFVEGMRSVNEWISVKEKLPQQEGVSYLVGVKNKNKEGGIFLIDIGYFEEGIFHKSNTWEDVTHWMNLPEEPKI